jgi:hypothetical protein
MLTDVTLDNDFREECIIQEIDKGISFLANAPLKQQQQQQQQQTQQQTKQLKQLQQQKTQQNVPKTTSVIKPENKKLQPCGMRSTTVAQIKNEQLMNAPTQCMVLSSGFQQTDQKPVIIQNVQSLKLPLPRNAKQNPIFIQPVNGNIPLQTVLPVATTQPQIQTVNLVSSTPMLKPGMFAYH